MTAMPQRHRRSGSARAGGFTETFSDASGGLTFQVTSPGGAVHPANGSGNTPEGLLAQTPAEPASGEKSFDLPGSGEEAKSGRKLSKVNFGKLKGKMPW